MSNLTLRIDHLLANENSLQQRAKDAERETQQHLDALRNVEGSAAHSDKRVQQLQVIEGGG